jgi:hypothetical protein
VRPAPDRRHSSGMRAVADGGRRDVRRR